LICTLIKLTAVQNDHFLWLEQRKNYKASELSISQQVKRQTGRSLASYPYPIYQMMKKVFPDFDPAGFPGSVPGSSDCGRSP